MFFILNFTDGSLPYNYFLFVFLASLGILQIIGARYSRENLLWFTRNLSSVVGSLTLVGAFMWFFAVQDDLFIPGLAGGELFIEFGGAFAGAVLVTRLIAISSGKLLTRWRMEKAERKRIPEQFR